MSVCVGIRKSNLFPLGLDPVNFPLAGFSFKIHPSSRAMLMKFNPFNMSP